jgi:hypothetical protein
LVPGALSLNKKVCRDLRPPEGSMVQLVAADPEL